MNEKEITYRWLTQADLERMLREAYRRGASAMRDAAEDVAHAEARAAMAEIRGCYCASGIASSIRQLLTPPDDA